MSKENKDAHNQEKKREIENKDPFVVMEHLQQQCSNHH
jgi:hypothetical protein